MGLERLLFASCHGYVDPSNGAATATRDLLEVLAGRGVACRALSTGVLDYQRETPLGPLLEGLGVPARRGRVALPGGDAPEVHDLTLGGVAVTLMATKSSRIASAPDRAEAGAFLALADRAFAEFRPQVLLTYGGHPANLALMALARRRGVAVAFALHNFAYTDRSPFAHADAVLVPTEYCRRFYQRRLGLACTALPYPIHPARVVAGDPEPRYLTFVNPVPEKGLAVFARVAAELGRLRPDVPILVVEGRGSIATLAEWGADLAGLATLHRMANTADPRAFYRVARAVLVPSLWVENAALVAREAMANGIPVLASDRGGLPETLGDSGFVLPVPARYTPATRELPTPREVAPWVAAVGRLWDDPAFEAEHRALARDAARRWEPGRVAGEYLEFFGRLIGAGRNGATA